MGHDTNLLGEYLRARRSLVTPEGAGIPASGTRRVPGLRREEVAMLAGISSEYYLRLEQGRDRNPSQQVLEALARVLEVDEGHLHKLAAHRSRRANSRPQRESVPFSTERLVHHLPFPSFVEGRYLDVLTSNALATAMSPRLSVGRNRLRDVFIDPEEQALFTDWRRAAMALVAGFRQAVGTNFDDPRVIQLVGELSLKSPYFRQIWARHDVGPRAGAALTIRHPLVGDLQLDREKLSIAGGEGLMLVIFHPERGSDSMEKLSLLASTLTPPGADVLDERGALHSRVE